MDAARILRYARRRAGLSQRELAERTGIAQPAIARIERGSSSPRVDTLDRLLRGAGLSLEGAPRLGTGVDRTLIRATRATSPEERILAAGRSGRNLIAFRNAVAHGRRRSVS
jgi:transcriptional regulator with XRE-family HTH domain